MIDINFDYSKVRGSTELHTKFKKEVMLAVSSKFPDVMIIPYDVGFFRAWSNPDIPVRCGVEGVLDLIVFGNGWYRLFDTKTGGAVLQKNQKAFCKRILDINQGKDKAVKINTVKQALDLIAHETNR